MHKIDMTMRQVGDRFDSPYLHPNRRQDEFIFKKEDLYFLNPSPFRLGATDLGKIVRNLSHFL